jgi:ATP-dependent Clp protease ATP-binding subunit ClpX
MSDCTPFTQAGYIGEDAEVCVQRLLAAANYDIARAERGIICLDEVDKIATARVSHGKDVSGEGVQQALLKIIEGTTLQITSKQERGSGRPSPGHPLGGGIGNTPTGSSGGKAETYNVRTDNILFIFTGAFIGLHKIILDRISKGSIGFNQPVRGSSSSPSHLQNTHDTMLPQADVHLFKTHLPFFTPTPSSADASSLAHRRHNALDLLEPADLQRYGLIPELVGRIPVSTALSPLDEDSLVRVLTEPRNSLMRQYEQLFHLSSVELRCTSAALSEIARTALKMGTGARGLRTVMERLLADAMFEAPGSSVRYVLITEAVAKREIAPIYFARGQQSGFHGMIAKEEEDWEDKRRKERGEPTKGNSEVQSFSQYRKRAQVPGSM